MEYPAQATRAPYSNEAKQGACTTAAPQSASEAILSRLSMLQTSVAGNLSVASHIAEKIVGIAPTPPLAGLSNGKDIPAAGHFLEAINIALSQLEHFAESTREHLDRLSRSF